MNVSTPCEKKPLFANHKEPTVYIYNGPFLAVKMSFLGN